MWDSPRQSRLTSNRERRPPELRRASGGPLRPSAPPLTLDITSKAGENVQASTAWLKSISPQASQRFVIVLNQQLRKLCKDNATNPATQIHDEASSYLARPIFAHLFRTSKTTQKRSPSGAWYLFYELIDTNQDGLPNTLRVLMLLHAAAQKPREAEMPQESTEADEGGKMPDSELVTVA